MVSKAVPACRAHIIIPDEAVRRHAGGWAVAIGDVTALAHAIHGLVWDDDVDSATRLLPTEHPCPVGEELLAHFKG
ncbi:DUF4291 domain-containing protein [Streptomyces sp. NPDC059755]|uniref:DUF4291 domain-containing protein n=1 Tax=Streptomyces sp. NPDC059755 TaxID=3346934 RepID=UPI00365FB8E2